MTPDELKARTKLLALRTIKLVEALPRKNSADVLGKQLLRSATSVGSNYRAACRARSRPEFLAKLGIVEEEADECVYWLELLVESNLIPAARVRDLMAEAHALAAIFVASIKTTRSRLQLSRSRGGKAGPNSEIRNPKSEM